MARSVFTNFNFAVDNLGPPPSQQKEQDSPVESVLRALRDGIVPMDELTARTSLSPTKIVEAVNDLLERGYVEILDESDGRKFIRSRL